ncbi:MAG: DUF4243 domain-containing protein [Myxococcales bacterium]|nr:DUF4243 domain-containing protein [Myxococcales bacterium]
MSNYDEALERFRIVGLEYADGLSNHGPMAAEALVGLGHQALIPALVDVYAPRLPAARAGRVLSEAEQASARGRVEHAADQVATFEARLEAAADWRDVIAREVPPLLPGLFAATGHGLLRTAHAIRALEREDSALRRGELARGLAHWSSRYQTLPGHPPPSSAPPADPATLAVRLEVWPHLADASARDQLFFEAVRRLDAEPRFVEAMDAIGRPAVGRAGLDAFLDALVRTGAALYLAHPDDRIAYAHAVTIPEAVRSVAPHLSETDASAAGWYALQAVGALHAVFGGIGDGAPGEPSETVRRTAESWDEIRYRAACSLQEHAIKLAEACLRADRRAPDPIFALAAADAALELEGRRSAGNC